MYYSMKRKNDTSVDKNAVWAFIAALSILSLIDMIYNTLGLGKNTVFTLIWLTSSGVFVWASTKLLRLFVFENLYFKYLFYLFMGYGLITVFRGLSFSTTDITAYLRVIYIFWPFLIPFFAFFGKRLRSYGFLLNTLFYLGLVYMVLIILIPSLLLSAKSTEIAAYSLVLGSGFVLMNSNYMSNRKVNFSFIFIIIATLSFVYLARRAGLFIMLGIIASSYLLIFFKKGKPLLFQTFPWLLGIGIIVFFYFDDVSASLLEEINKRLYEDTRSTVTDMFFIDMENYLTLGKGMNATYYCPIGGGLSEDGLDYEVIYYRDVIENGYLQLMLSGGIVHIILFLLIAVPAAFNGIFKSSNQFSKSCGTLILLWLVFMIGSGLPSLSLGYVLVWISIGVCYRKSILMKTDEEIYEGFYGSERLS